MFAVPKMDCPSEERMIRLAFDGLPGVADLRFDLRARTLTVVHAGDAGPLLAKLVAGALVAWTGSRLPDLVIGTAVGVLVLGGAVRILRLRCPRVQRRGPRPGSPTAAPSRCALRHGQELVYPSGSVYPSCWSGIAGVAVSWHVVQAFPQPSACCFGATSWFRSM